MHASFSRREIHQPRKMSAAFTVVELVVVIVVIGILATLAVVGYRGYQNRAAEATVQSDISSIAKLLGVDKALSGTYPSSLDQADSGGGVGLSRGNSAIYDATAGGYCLTIYNERPGVPSYHVSNSDTTPQKGACSGHTVPSGGGASNGNIADGTTMQTITSANCPSTRTRVVDARDNHTYWIQKLTDGKCWMLTNLSYAGGGANTHGDAKALSNGSADTERTYTVAKYYIPSGANPTVGSVSPSTSTDGGVTNPQYGYYYNWCAAMGGQATAACANATTPAPNPSISICPAGWRLPTAGDFVLLNNTVNNGSNSNDEGMRNTWLMQYAGAWGASYIVRFEPGVIASYHTSEQ
ncbi:MAG TPA: FISUMP domain-containing protein, partial [Candidatus Saccharibacteria bacterium]|nr:FISUMP domain-containing protein [Candidatus Saccharibacteria bacterium]